MLPASSAAIRPRLDHWFERAGIKPNIVGEFEGSALLNTFGAGVMGVFPVADLIHAELIERYSVMPVDTCDGVAKQFYAISAHNKISHTLMQKLLPQ